MSFLLKTMGFIFLLNIFYIFSFCEDNTVSLKFVGDIVSYSDFPAGRFSRPKDFSGLMDPVKEQLQEKDVLIGNLEGPITVSKNLTKVITEGRHAFAFRFPPMDTEMMLKNAGFDILHIANNHMRDFGEIGLINTMSNIAKFGMEYSGIRNRIAYWNTGQILLGVIGFFYSGSVYNNLHDYEETEKLIQEAKQKADIVIITMHAGGEGLNAMHVKNKEEIFYKENRGNVYEFAHKAIDYGADCVIGSGPHVLRGLEFYRGKLIAYSLGNFMGYGGALSTQAQLAYSAILEIRITKTGEFQSGRIIPLIIQQNGIPVPDPDKKSIGFINNLSSVDFTNSAAMLDKDGNIILK